MRRLLWFPVFVLLFCGCQTEETARYTVDTSEAPEVEFAPATRVPIDTNLDLVGTLLPVRATTIVSEVDGVIQAFPASDRTLKYEENGTQVEVPLALNLGHTVCEGEVLVEIDPLDFQLDLDVAKARHELAVKNLDLLKNWQQQEEKEQLLRALQEAKSALEHAQSEMARAERLRSQKAISDSEYDQRKMTLDTAEAAWKQAEAVLQISEKRMPAQVEVAAAQVAVSASEVKIRSEKLRKTKIVAPYDGVIVDRYVSKGERVTAMPRVEIMRIIDPQGLFAEIDVPERYQNKIELDKMAAVMAAGIAGEVPARVEIINAMVDPETRTFRVRLLVDNRKGLLKPGGFVHASLPIATRDAAVAVPRRAVTFTDGNPSVFVFERGVQSGSGKVRRVAVELGVANDRVYEIAAGLTAGELVAVDRIPLLADGLRVRHREASNETMAAMQPRSFGSPESRPVARVAKQSSTP